MKRTHLRMLNVSLVCVACQPLSGLFGGDVEAPSLSAVTYPAGSYPRSIALGDLNGDGAPDVVTANDDSDDVSVLLNNGLGALSAAKSFATTENPLGVDLGDFDQDGDLDIVAANFHIQGQSQLSLLFNDGTGNFSEPVALPFAGFSMGYNVKVADLNDDGLVDLIAQDFSDTILFFNQGAGVFGPEQFYSEGFFHYDFAVGDLDHDGKIDLVSGGGNTADSGLRLRTNNGSGQLQTPISIQNKEVPNGIQIGDLNGDGLADIAVCFETANKIEALINVGGDFVSTQKQRTGDNPNNLALADMNGDNTLDILTANYDSGDVGILFNDGAANFSKVTQYAIGASPMKLAVADLNGDGLIDVVTANPADNSVTVLLSATENPGPINR
jgi:hypothetical protein